MPTAKTPHGVRLREGMREIGQGSAGGRLEVLLEIRDLHRFRSDRHRRLRATGWVTLAGVPGRNAIEGELRLFPDGADYLMRYDMAFRDADGRHWSFVGVKRQDGSGPIARYRGLTTVAVHAHPVGHPARAVDTVLRLRPVDVLRNGTSLRGQGSTFWDRRRAFSTFSSLFLRDLAGPSRVREEFRARRASQRR